MDRQMILDYLKFAERHVANGTAHVKRQRQVIADLDRDGHPTGRSEQLLAVFENFLTMHIAVRDRLLGELRESDSRANSSY